MQFELSISGISTSLLAKCLQKARKGLDQSEAPHISTTTVAKIILVLETMSNALPTPRPQLKSSVPFQDSVRMSAQECATLRARDGRLDAFLRRSNVEVRRLFLLFKQFALKILLYRREKKRTIRSQFLPSLQPMSMRSLSCARKKWRQVPTYKKKRMFLLFMKKAALLKAKNLLILLFQCNANSSHTLVNFRMGQNLSWSANCRCAQRSN